MWWKSDWRDAYFQASLGNGLVKCGLCPRGCVLKEGQDSVCGVRGNRGGKLVTFIYGKGVQPTEEFIETEAVYHFDPGARVLSLGNIGCNLDCDYCQNWQTSQVRHMHPGSIHNYSPEEVVEKALSQDVNILSWTYNDPVVWHEFVTDTAALAKEAGMTNLFKSAFYVGTEAIDDLLKVIDVFSISVKSMDPGYYRRITSGRLKPVLEGARQVYKAGKHLEISNLMITGISDGEDSARKAAEWLLSDLGPEVPLHFVGFHPAYRFTDSERTPLPRLLRAKQVAEEMGVENVYLGNVYDHELNTSHCRQCGAALVKRFGLRVETPGLSLEATCVKCGAKAFFKLNRKNRIPQRTVPTIPHDTTSRTVFKWTAEANSVHAELTNTSNIPSSIFYTSKLTPEADNGWHEVMVPPKGKYRIIITRKASDDEGCVIVVPTQTMKLELMPVLDRAHFPV